MHGAEQPRKVCSSYSNPLEGSPQFLFSGQGPRKVSAVVFNYDVYRGIQQLSPTFHGDRTSLYKR